MSDELANAPQGGLRDLFTLGFDVKAFCADPDFRLGIEKVAAALKRAASAPLNLDDKAIDIIVTSIEGLLDQVKNSGGLIVGADTPVTTAEASTYLTNLAASTGTVFSAEVMAKVQAHPELVRILKKKSPEYQAKLLNSEWLDTVIGWLVKYGPTIAQMLMIFLPLLL